MRVRRGALVAAALALALQPSVGAPELPVREIGLGETAPASLDHFVSCPAVGFTAR